MPQHLVLPSLVVSLLGVIGLTGVLRAIWYMMRGTMAASWPTMPGQIKSAEVQERHTGRTTKVRAEVRYTYRVEGVEYSADRVFFGDRVYSTLGMTAAREVTQYHPDATVQVYYNPDDHKDAVLEPGINGQVWLMLVASLAFMVLGAVAYWYQRPHGH